MASSHQSTGGTPHRYLELDLLRTGAVAAMIVYHTAYDLQMFYGWDIGVLTGGWRMLARATACTFLLLVGVSFAISWHRRRAVGASWSTLFLRSCKRGLLILACAMLVTLATYAFDPHTYVRFGVLHLIGVSIFLLPFLAQLRLWTMPVGVGVLAVGFLIDDITAPNFLLLPLGMMPQGFQSIDYFPLLPWCGVVLLGYGAGCLLYVRSTQWRVFLPAFLETHSSLPATDHAQLAPLLAWPGRHALLLYLIHQPIIIGVLFIVYRLLTKK